MHMHMHVHVHVRMHMQMRMHMHMHMRMRMHMQPACRVRAVPESEKCRPLVRERWGEVAMCTSPLPGIHRVAAWVTRDTELSTS